ncbi:MAG TPA: PVC-type heme-binding CxxCH protein [Pirellulales bacterium]|nr:PVC-type heme-binding CxxCH protein [Pirellulales bacterium]
MHARFPFSLLLLLAASQPARLTAAEPDAPIPPEQAVEHITLPKGFQATLFAGEPDVVQPIALTFDDRGRMWVVECLSYPDWNREPGAAGGDRVVIFEDADGDGRFDSRKVFWDKGSNLSGLELGFGGVWLCSTPNLVFVPDADGDDVPDGEPEIVLDGWDINARHNVFNALAWGPDGWLYGCNGILSNSKIGKPGSADAERTEINCGVWRYHPTKKIHEAVAHGTTNPWGLDFDDLGQMFITNCVIEHLWHVVPGAHFQRMFGQDIDPYSFRLMESCADHIHWGGGHWTSSRGGGGEHDKPGGGHAHSGAMIYLGDNWPDEYRSGLFTCNIHGTRVNHDVLERRGSGFVAHHGEDVFFMHDPWFRGLVVKQGPDGGVYVSDWTDSGECHDYEDIHRTSGRIYKATYGRPKPFKMDLAALGDAELVELQLHKNDWQVRHARRLLQERAAAGKLQGETRAALVKLLEEQPDVTRKLRALWALHAIGGLMEAELAELLESSEEYVRGWAIQLALEDRQVTAEQLARFEALAKSDPSPVVRLYLASGMQRLPLDERWNLAAALTAHGEDATDANLPLMLWYAVQPLVAADATRALALSQQAKIPLVRQFLARRAASGIPAEVEKQSADALDPLSRVLGRVDDPAVQLDLLSGVREALAGRRRVLTPQGWAEVYRKLSGSPNREVRDQATLLSLIFGDAGAFATLRKTMMDQTVSSDDRRRALEALVEMRDADTAPLAEKLIAEPALRGAALRALAAYADERAPEIILRNYAAFNDAESADAILTLASRPAFALALLEAIERGQIPRRDVSAFTIRQLQSMKDDRVNERLAKVWGAVRPPSKDKAAAIGKHKALLSPQRVQNADRSAGRGLFVRHCGACHKLFGEGGQVGPELTGSQRANLDYLLENLIDPSAIVARDYQMTVLQTEDGRILNGIIVQEDDQVLAIQTQNERLSLPLAEIEARERSPLSLMPEGLLDKLSEAELRDLVVYLSGAEQAALPGAGR